MPSHRISSGSSAILGMGKVAAMSGVPTASASAEDTDREADHHAAQRAHAEAEQDAAETGGDVAQQLAAAQHLPAGRQHAERRGQEQRGHPARAREQLPQHQQAGQPQPARHRVLAPRQRAGAVGDGARRHATPSRSAARACDLISAQMRSTASTNARSPSIASVRGRLQRDRHDLQHAARPPREHDDPVGQPHRLVDVVGHVEDRLARPLPDRQQLLLHELARLGVERRERLVHQQHGRVDGERPRDADALPHAARELVRVLALEAAQPGQLDEAAGDRAGARPAAGRPPRGRTRRWPARCARGRARTPGRPSPSAAGPPAARRRSRRCRRSASAARPAC